MRLQILERATSLQIHVHQNQVGGTCAIRNNGENRCSFSQPQAQCSITKFSELQKSINPNKTYMSPNSHEVQLKLSLIHGIFKNFMNPSEVLFLHWSSQQQIGFLFFLEYNTLRPPIVNTNHEIFAEIMS